MGIQNFFQAIDFICEQDTRYHIKSYIFVRQALDFTVDKLQKTKQSFPKHHISGQELLDGIRLFALSEFGPMANILFESWGVRTTEDFGNIVFNMVNANLLGKSEEDRIEDFQNGYSFFDVFEKPFLPKKNSELKKSKKKTA